MEGGCTESDTTDKDTVFFLQHDIVCSIQDKAAIPKTWIQVDSQSTVDMFSSVKILTNIHDVRRKLTLYCNVGKAITTKRCVLKGYGTV